MDCWKKRLLFASMTGTLDSSHTTFQQCLELPRAISTSDGNLNKGTKANTTKVYENRYDTTPKPIILTILPKDWTPTVVIMEGMFLINNNPWSAHRTFGDYGDFLMRQHICPYYRNGAREVHLLFNNPESQVYSPKRFEREQRDRINPVNDEHCCGE